MKGDIEEKGAIIQRDRELFAVAPHIPGGILDSNILRKIADVADKYRVKAIKITGAQRIALIGIKKEDIDAIWKELKMKPGAAIGLCVRSVKICPGTTFCKRGIQDSVSIGLKLDSLYTGKKLPGKLKIGVSGCPNSCAEAAVKDIGLIGRKNGFNILIGGTAGARPRIADLLAEDIPPDKITSLVEKIINYYEKNARPHERLGRMIDRIGFEEVKRAILNS